MADAMTYGFEVIVSNSKRNDTQNITGFFGTVADDTFTPAEVEEGFLCKQHARTLNEGYGLHSIKNKNTWEMVAANNGLVATLPGDHTGIYAANTYNVNALTDGGLVVNFPGKTLGLKTPAGERCDFTEIIIGEMYAFGYKNTAVTGDDSEAKDATFAEGEILSIVNGKLSTAAATAGHLAFEIIDATGRFTEGAADGGRKIIVRAIKAAS